MSSQVIDPVKSKTSMLHFSEAHFEKNLSQLKNTQESIQSLSSWCLQHKQHHKKIVNSWFKVMKKAKMESRLTLFYLANDVIQYSKRKSLDFVHTWALFLQRAVTLVRDDKIKPNILRIFKIWTERGIFDEAFIADLTGLLESPKGVSSDTAKLIAEFQPMKLIDKVRSCKILEDDTDLKLLNLKDSPLELTDVDALRNNLKDRRHGADLVSEVEDGGIKMEAYVKSLRDEITDRAKLIELLEQGTVFYEHQKGEAKIVLNAYRNFGSRVKNLKRKLDELLPSLPSPVPSPDIDAPSPTPSDTELELPGELGMAGSCFDISVPESHPVHAFMQASSEHVSLGMGSFMGSGSLPFDLKGNLFQDNDEMLRGNSIDNSSSEGKPIEVIGSRSGKSDENFSISDFLKSLTQGDSAKSPAPVIPGLGSVPPLDAIPLPNRQDSKPSSQYSGPPFEQALYNVFSTPPPPPPSSMVSTSDPLQPPPIPPDMYMPDQQWGSYMPEDMLEASSDWNTKLPSKFPIWTEEDGNWDSENLDDSKEWDMGNTSKMSKLDETPMSPPMFEKEGFNEPVQYDDRSGTIAEDVDHRSLMMPHSRAVKKDVDHRNLISLTGSPASHHKSHSNNQANKPAWNKSAVKDLDFRVNPPISGRKNEVLASSSVDQDYRQPPPNIPPTYMPSTTSPNEKAPGNFIDNVESVDMEMSDEENGVESSTNSQNATDSKRFESNQNNKKNNNSTMLSQHSDSRNTNRASNQQKNSFSSTNQRSHQSNGPQKATSPLMNQKPLLGTTRPVLPSLVTGPLIQPPSLSLNNTMSSPQKTLLSSPTKLPQNSSTVSPPKPPLLLAKTGLLPTPPPLMPSLSSKPTMQTQEDTSYEQEEMDTTPAFDESENGDWGTGAPDEWVDQSDQKFVERMHASDAFDEDRGVHQVRSPRTRARRGNQLGAGGNFSARGKPLQSEFSQRGGPQFAGASPGFPNRGGFRGSYRPFRGPRRGNFSRW